MITLLTQANCTLCDHAKAVLDRVGADQPLTIAEIPFDSEEGLRISEAMNLVFAPGVLLDGQAFAYGRLSERRLRRALRQRAEASAVTSSSKPTRPLEDR